MKRSRKFDPITWGKRTLFRVPYQETSLDYQGFECDQTIKPHLEEILTRFLDGYHLALNSDSLAELAQRLDSEIALALRGFAYEGAGMSLAIMDYVTPWKQNRVQEFIAGHGKSHDYIICIGAGFAVARLPWTRRNAMHYARRYPPGLAALVLDGYGFHEGFFHSARVIDRCERPQSLTGYGGRCFDAGLGRALWFVKGASPERLRDALQHFTQERRADLWAGLGLACAYAGSAYPDLKQFTSVLERLMEYAGPYRRQLELGVVFAAATRCKGHNPTAWTTHACEVVLRLPYLESASLGLDMWNSITEEEQRCPEPDRSLLKHQLVNERVMRQLASRSRNSIQLPMFSRANES
jgi:hypothetical protein